MRFDGTIFFLHEPYFERARKMGFVVVAGVDRRFGAGNLVRR